MKKIFFVLLTGALLVSFSACNKAKQTEEVAPQATVTEEVKAPETPAVAEPTPAEALKAFQDFAKEYGESFNNMMKDPTKFQKLAGQLQQKLADIERYKVNLTPQQVKDYEKALKIITDVNSGGKK
ncbi:hypothetical protein AGMMS50262_20040 [Bacteroidia bacterium]|nr:hypothetical protein AGMMS50262_20040 [Bacteroidia bacterium]